MADTMTPAEVEADFVRDLVNRGWQAYRRVVDLGDDLFWRMTPATWSALRRARFSDTHSPVDAPGVKFFGVPVRTADIGPRELELVIQA